MKKTRVIFLIVFMLSMSVFAFVSQGEELTTNKAESKVESNPSKHVNIGGEINRIKTEMALQANNKLVAPKPAVQIEPERAILNQEIGVLQYSANKKSNTYTESRELIYNNELDERAQIIVELTPLDGETARIVLDYADRYNIRPSLILGIMDLESNFGQFLVGTSQDRGYMQIIPGTEKWLATAYGEELGLTYNPDNIFDADYNIPLAVKYLAILKIEYKGNDTKMLTSYNRGNAGLNKWFAKHGTYETAYSRVILKREQKYLDVK